MRSEHVKNMSRMKLSLQKELHKQRTNEDAKVEGIRRQANQVFSFHFLSCYLSSKMNFLRQPNNFFMIKH